MSICLAYLFIISKLEGQGIEIIEIYDTEIKCIMQGLQKVSNLIYYDV
jgi:hypothetical protein